METRQNLQSVMSRYPNSGDLGPLAANESFSRAINAELNLLQDAADRSAALATRNEDLTAVVTMFSNAVTALRAISARYPEAAVPINEAIKQTQLAMGLVRDNPPPAVAAPGAPGTFHFGGREANAPAPVPVVAAVRGARAPAAPMVFSAPARPAPLSNVDAAARRAEEANRRGF